MLGYLYTTVYIFFCAYSFVFVGESPRIYSKEVTLFFSSLIGTLFFQALNLGKAKALWEKIKKCKWSILGLNISSGFGWMTAILALHYIDAATMLCLNAGSIPLFGLLILEKKEGKKRPTFFFALGAIILSISLIIYQNLTLKLYPLTPTACATGVALSLFDGLCSTYNGHFCKQLTRGNIRPKEVLAFRFIGLILLSLTWALFQGNFSSVHGSDFPDFLFSATVMMIVPLIFYQKGVAELDALRFSMLMPFIPIVAYFMEVGMGYYPFHPTLFLSILFCAISLFYFQWGIHQNKARLEKKNPPCL